MTVTDRRDEQPHPPGADPEWGEAWTFELTAPDGSLTGFVQLGLIPAAGIGWYWSFVTGAGRDPVVVADPEVPLPRSGLAIRTEGLWADHIVEEPFDHVSVGCEAFALRLDAEDVARAKAGGMLLGERTPYGLDLGWETAGPVVAVPSGYEMACQVVGEILVGDERIELDGSGTRRHIWGPGVGRLPSETWLPRAVVATKRG